MFVFSINNQEKVISTAVVSNDNRSICFKKPVYSYEIDLLFNRVEFFKTHCNNEDQPKTKFLWRKIVKVYNEKCYDAYLRSQN